MAQTDRHKEDTAPGLRKSRTKKEAPVNKQHIVQHLGMMIDLTSENGTAAALMNLRTELLNGDFDMDKPFD